MEWNLLFPLKNSFNKTEAAVFPCMLSLSSVCILVAFQKNLNYSKHAFSYCPKIEYIKALFKHNEHENERQI